MWKAARQVGVPIEIRRERMFVLPHGMLGAFPVFELSIPKHLGQHGRDWCLSTYVRSRPQHCELCILAVCLPEEVVCEVKGTTRGQKSRNKGQGTERHEASCSGMAALPS